MILRCWPATGRPPPMRNIWAIRRIKPMRSLHRLPSDTTYYWRVDMIDANNQVHVGEVWRFSCGTTHMTELLKDPYFQHGLQVYGHCTWRSAV